jgi:hypothetical protein
VPRALAVAADVPAPLAAPVVLVQPTVIEDNSKIAVRAWQRTRNDGADIGGIERKANG